MPVCSQPGCPTILPKSGRCPTHARTNNKARGTRQARGYTTEHDRLRRTWAPRVATGTILCNRCKLPIQPGTPWALDHDNTRTTYRGPAHKHCNDSAGGTASHR